MVYRIASFGTQVLRSCAEGVLKNQLLTVNLLTLRREVFLECLVVVLAVAQLSVDEADEFYGCLEAEFLVLGTEDVLMENISYALLLQPQTREEFIIALQRNLVLQVHSRHHSIHALVVHFGKAEAAFLQKEMAGMFHLVQIVGIVHDALNIALIISYFHLRLKNISAHNFLFLVTK